jgi:hypothetical protein
MTRLLTAVSFAMLTGACGGGFPIGPTSPAQAPSSEPTFTVSGVVVAQTPTGSAPVEGVEVRVAGQYGTTDGNGYYSLPGVPKSYGGVSAVKAGYAAAREILTVSGDTRFDFQLGPRVAIYTLSGVVSEVTPTGRVPVEGVLVHEYSCEDVSPAPPFFSGSCPVYVFQTTKTDKTGFYRFSGLYAGRKNGVGVSDEGFDDPRTDPHGPEGNGEDVTINGDTRLDLQLVRR